MSQSRFSHSYRRGIIVGIAGTLLIIFRSAFIPLLRSGPFGHAINAPSPILYFIMNWRYIRIDEGTLVSIVLLFPFFAACVIAFLCVRGFSTNLSRPLRHLYLILLILDGLVTIAYLPDLFWDAPDGFLLLFIGFICISVGYESIRKDAANKSTS